MIDPLGAAAANVVLSEIPSAMHAARLRHLFRFFALSAAVLAAAGKMATASVAAVRIIPACRLPTKKTGSTLCDVRQ